MIVKMKKLTLLVAETTRQEMLEALRALGVVHIDNIQKPSFENMHVTEEALLEAKQAFAVLNEHKGKALSQQLQWDGEDAKDQAKEIVSLYKERLGDIQELDNIRIKLEWFKAWGGFDPSEIKALSLKGVFINLYAVNKNQLKEIEHRKDISIISRK